MADTNNTNKGKKQPTLPNLKKKGKFNFYWIRFEPNHLDKAVGRSIPISPLGSLRYRFMRWQVIRKTMVHGATSRSSIGISVANIRGVIRSQVLSLADGDGAT